MTDQGRLLTVRRNVSSVIFLLFRDVHKSSLVVYLIHGSLCGSLKSLVYFCEGQFSQNQGNKQQIHAARDPKLQHGMDALQLALGICQPGMMGTGIGNKLASSYNIKHARPNTHIHTHMCTHMCTHVYSHVHVY